MLSVAGIATNLQRVLVPEKIQLKSQLRVRELAQLNLTTAQATVEYSSRWALEQFQWAHIREAMPSLSRGAVTCIHETFREIVQVRHYNLYYPMARLHGFFNSKSDQQSRPQRVACTSMAEMGAMVNDLKDLKGLEGPQLIEKCKTWYELRLHQGIHLYTDTWHRRFYWNNSGGSHHMAVLCHQLAEQKVDWSPEVKVTEYDVDLTRLARLQSRGISAYVIKYNRKLLGAHNLFVIPKHLKHRTVVAGLGVAVPDLWVPSFPFNTYQFVFIDQSRRYSQLVLPLMEHQVGQGKAMPIEKFFSQMLQKVRES